MDSYTKGNSYPESKLVVNTDTKEVADNSEVDNSAATPKTMANKRYAIVANKTTDIEIIKNITSISAIIKNDVFDCFPVNYTDVVIVE